MTAAAQKLIGNMGRACLVVENAAVSKLAIGQPVKRTKSGRLRGLNPSTPPNPPHSLSGRLRQNIGHAVERQGMLIVGRVGTNVEYSARLEFGFYGTDSKGRRYNTPARPFLRPALAENLDRVGALIGSSS
jgi:phage gpG-like protein